MLLAPGCGRRTDAQSPSRDEPVRRASFRSLAARDFLSSCPAVAARREVAYQAAAARGAEAARRAQRRRPGGLRSARTIGRACRAMRDREACAARRGGLSPGARRLLHGALDTLAGRIAEYAGSEGVAAVGLGGRRDPGRLLATGRAPPGTGWSRAPDLSVYSAMLALCATSPGSNRSCAAASAPHSVERPLAPRFRRAAPTPSRPA